MDEEELAALEAAKAKEAAEKAAAEEANKAKEKESKLSDEAAKLLKENMAYKEKLKAAQDEAEKAKSAARAFEGMNAEEVRAMLAEKAERELKEAEKRGEYDRILDSVRSKAEEREKAFEAEKVELQKQLQTYRSQIDELTLGSSFRGSEFLNKETILTGDKARRLYGEYFEIENGAIVGYDKPRGSTERTPLVDERGSKLGFEAALEKIVRADGDFERFQKSKMKPGAGSKPADTSKQPEDKGSTKRGVERIQLALKKFGK